MIPMPWNGRGCSKTATGRVRRSINRRHRIALVTCAELPQLDADTQRVITPLAARGLEAVPAVWSDVRVDWSSFDLAVVRSCWDYVERYAEFLAWTRRMPRLANPPGRHRVEHKQALSAGTRFGRILGRADAVASARRPLERT